MCDSKRIKELEAENERLRDTLECMAEEAYFDEVSRQADEENAALEAAIIENHAAEEAYWNECQQEHDLNLAWEKGIKSQDKAVAEGLRSGGSEAGRAMRARRKDSK